MSSPELGPFRSVLDEAPWALEAADIITGRITVTADTVTGWTPPPMPSSVWHTDLCGHRDELAYEHTLAVAAQYRRAADEIAALRHATYPQHTTPTKKRRPAKKATKA